MIFEVGVRITVEVLPPPPPARKVVDGLVCCKYTGTVKRHNVGKSHLSIDNGFKQTERAIFLRVTTMKQPLITKLSVNFGNRSSSDSHKNQYPGPDLNFGFTEPQYGDKC